ncbi:type IV pilus twitching motility protein PilT [candidate division WWE3 bacterium]|uniref:Type IV pilus twitching motility protein PilT n=1 Tax=candidate division WWE3 bacterium TaxID=2053526 RepID=A0A955RQ19_UNCKA|nr:type IV pilus twitching motility protein PilT [candidate division WWE3 bacterium]
MTIQQLLEEVVKRDSSDLHLNVGAMPMVRIDGTLVVIEGTHPLTKEEVEELVLSILTDEQRELLYANKEIDLSFALGEIARFRVNIYHQKGYLGAAFRHIPSQIRSLQDLNMPGVLANFTKLNQGFVLVTGPTGHGKSTTLAALVDLINETRADHIVTIEDPIEYVYPHRKSLVSQREMHTDTYSWDIALRSVLREDPDVVLIGEMRDYETTEAALLIAETGHLVFSTLHTNSASQTINRVIDQFPEQQQQQVRTQLSSTLVGIVSQRLVPGIGGGRYPAAEILLTTPAIKNMIREDKVHQIDNIIQTGQDTGMMSLEASLAGLVKAGKISLEKAREYTLRPEVLKRMMAR